MVKVVNFVCNNCKTRGETLSEESRWEFPCGTCPNCGHIIIVTPSSPSFTFNKSATERADLSEAARSIEAEEIALAARQMGDDTTAVEAMVESVELKKTRSRRRAEKLQVGYTADVEKTS